MLFLLTTILSLLPSCILSKEIANGCFFTPTTTSKNKINITKNCISEEFSTQSITECILQCNMRKLKTPVWKNQQCYCLKEECKSRNFRCQLEGKNQVKWIQGFFKKKYSQPRGCCVFWTILFFIVLILLTFGTLESSWFIN